MRAPDHWDGHPPLGHQNGGMTTSDTSTANPIHQRQLQGRRVRLERELTAAFGARPLCGALIERLVIDLAAVECALAGESLPNDTEGEGASVTTEWSPR